MPLPVSAGRPEASRWHWMSQQVQRLALKGQAGLQVLQPMLVLECQAAQALPLPLDRQHVLGWQAAVLLAAPPQLPWRAEAEEAAAALPSCGPPADHQSQAPAAKQEPARHCCSTRRETVASPAPLLRPALRLPMGTGLNAQTLAECHQRGGWGHALLTRKQAAPADTVCQPWPGPCPRAAASAAGPRAAARASWRYRPARAPGRSRGGCCACGCAGASGAPRQVSSQHCPLHLQLLPGRASQAGH